MTWSDSTLIFQLLSKVDCRLREGAWPHAVWGLVTTEVQLALALASSVHS